MKVLNIDGVAGELARALNKPIILLVFCDDDEVEKAAPYIDFVKETIWIQCLTDGYAIIICGDEAEQERLYEQTVGDDGPTKTNDYSGPSRVYATTFDRNGRGRNCNT